MKKLTLVLYGVYRLTLVLLIDLYGHHVRVYVCSIKCCVKSEMSRFLHEGGEEGGGVFVS